jgi:hypothetical protein
VACGIARQAIRALHPPQRGAGPRPAEHEHGIDRQRPACLHFFRPADRPPEAPHLGTCAGPVRLSSGGWTRNDLSGLAGDRYSPGFLASILLRVPIGAAYLQAVNSEEPLKRSDLAKAMALNFAFAVTSIAGPNVLLKDKNSRYRFTAKQMGPRLPGSSAD